jgi:pimeloyl-ACP methyl ester carboxylesterase
MRERVLLVGEAPALVGIVTEPEGELDPSLPVLIVLNSGLVPRVGPYRSTVKFTRRAAREGFAAVRFDLSGVGDSDARRDNASFEERWIADTRAVMDHLEKTRGATRFVIMGLCSGADNAFQTAKRDARVAGIVQVDGYAYKTPGYHARYYGKRLRDPEVMKRFAQRAAIRLRNRFLGKLGAATARAEASESPPLEPSAAADAQYMREFPPRDEVAADLRTMLARGLELCVVHSGGMEIYYNHASQFRDAFRDVDFGDALTVHYFEEADHTFTELAQQRALQEAVAEWLRQRFLVRRATAKR